MCDILPRRSEEFSNFYWHDTAFRFVMPDFAKQSWTPPEIDCHFSEKAKQSGTLGTLVEVTYRLFHTCFVKRLQS